MILYGLVSCKIFVGDQVWHIIKKVENHNYFSICLICVVILKQKFRYTFIYIYF